MKIHLIRHGEVDNPQNVIYERLDGFSLSQKGFEMAENVSNIVLEDKEMSTSQALFVSPLLRTQQTAKPISQKLNVEIITDENLIEAMNFFRGKKKTPSFQNILNPKNLPYFCNPFRPTWGERFNNIAFRMKVVIDKILREYPTDSNIIIVSHQSPIWRIRRFYEQKPLWIHPKKNECSLCSITTLTFDENAEYVETKYMETTND